MSTGSCRRNQCSASLASAWFAFPAWGLGARPMGRMPLRPNKLDSMQMEEPHPSCYAKRHYLALATAPRRDRPGVVSTACS